MASLDYGAILKVNGKLRNINSGSLFMDMEDAVGFTIMPIPYEFEFEGEIYSGSNVIDGNYFVYFGDEELLFCVYKDFIATIVNKKDLTSYDLRMEDKNNKNLVRYIDINGANIKIKRICNDDRKLHALVQYKGVNYEVLYGYGIENNIRVFREISKKRQYGYNKKNIRYIENFINQV